MVVYHFITALFLCIVLTGGNNNYSSNQIISKLFSKICSKNSVNFLCEFPLTWQYRGKNWTKWFLLVWNWITNNLTIPNYVQCLQNQPTLIGLLPFFKPCVVYHQSDHDMLPEHWAFDMLDFLMCDPWTTDSNHLLMSWKVLWSKNKVDSKYEKTSFTKNINKYIKL